MATGDSLLHRGIPVDPALRALAAGSLINTVGRGALMTTFALYFTRHHGLSATQVGLAMGIAAVVGFFVQVPAGHLGDIRGPREVMLIGTLLTAIAQLGLMVTTNLVALIVVLSVQTMFERGTSAVRTGVMAQLASGPAGVQFRAYLRAVTNTGLGLGAALGGLALIVDTPAAYLSVFGLNAVSTAISALFVRALPHLPTAPTRAAGEPRLVVLRDLPYLVLTVLTGALFSLHFVVMDLALPIWIGTRTDAPSWVVAASLILNTACVALFQLRLSRGADDVRSSARRLAIGAAWILGGFVLISLAGRQGPLLATGLLVAGVLVHVVGEMVGSGGQWGIQMGLAPMERQGQYQGFAGTGFTLSTIIGPPLVAWACIDHGPVGWWGVGLIIVVAGVVSIPASAWALRTRARYGVLTHTG